MRSSEVLAVVVSALILTLASCNKSSSRTATLLPGPKEGPLRFTNATEDAGLVYRHAVKSTTDMPGLIAGGVACGDYDGDGWLDLYVVRGSAGANLLFRNKADGTFEEVGAKAGVAVTGENGSGPAFVDFDGDGDLDLFVGGTLGTKPRLFENTGKGTFTDITKASGVTTPSATSFSVAFGDVDGDGDLDFFLAHWGDRPKFRAAKAGHLWRNNGNGTFTDISEDSGILKTLFSRDDEEEDFTFSPNFADIDDDGHLDLLVCSDFGESRVYINRGDGTFDDATDHAVITDENGMGTAVGDYDNDGDLDWFVSSVWLPPGSTKGNDFGVTGNRLYRNKGDGTFEDVTSAAGVREGYWGWGASFADFDNDGWLDIIHTNGFGRVGANGLPTDPTMAPFVFDPTRLFMSNGDGTFTERAKALGLEDPGQGRGIVCFDYDKDGDLDVFIANNDQEPTLWRNDGVKGNWLTVRLKGKAPNSEGIGARVHITIAGALQMRELRSGCNFVSQDPATAHFGLGLALTVDKLWVQWPDGTETVQNKVPVNQEVVVQQ